MDPALTVGLVSVATAIVTTAGGVIVAMVTNRREAENAADDARELTLRERLKLRDEQIAALEHKVQNRDDKIARLELELERLIVARADDLEGPDHA